MWPDRRLLDLFAIDVPILQAPMAGASDVNLAIAVAKAGGLGALPAGMLSAEQIRSQVVQFRTAAREQRARACVAGATQALLSRVWH
jgi:nitronate monooxygenase